MHHPYKKLILSALFTLWTAGAPASDQAQNVIPISSTSAKGPATPTPVIYPQQPDIDAKAYLLIDADSGAVLAEKNMNDRLPPASLTKLMTAYVVSHALKEGQIKLTDLVTVSPKAWKMGGSRMFIQVGSQVSVKDLLDGIIVASGNDACVAIAEHMAGTEDTFVQIMNQDAARLGMKNTHYTDSTGMPDPDHYSTAYDLAILTRSIIKDYPEDYAWYKKKWIVFNNIRQPNRNRLLWQDPSVDGLKTGHTESAGYCLVSSALRHNMRLIAVVLGAPSDQARTQDSQTLLNFGYRFFETHQLFSAGQPLDQKMQPRVWYGKEKYAQLGFAKNAYVTIPVNQFKQMQANIIIQQKIKAPVIEGQVYGTVNISLNGETLTSIPVVALKANPKGSIFSRTWDHIAILFSKWFGGV